jgi:hypothetical protein
MPNVRRQVAAETPGAEEQSVSAPTKGTPDEALDLIFAPLKAGDGFRHYSMGAPGYGKTVSMRWVVAAAIERDCVDVVLTHDVKLAVPEFPDAVMVASVQDARELEASHINFRGDVMRDIAVSVEEVAVVGKGLAQKGQLRVLLNVGELDNALSPGGKSWASPTAQWFTAQGRALKSCLTATIQQPKRTPDEVWDQATSIALHHHEERSTNYLVNTLELDPELVAILPKLDKFEFILRLPGGYWNRKVYRVAPPGL